jgi:hypothetical protein
MLSDTARIQETISAKIVCESREVKRSRKVMVPKQCMVLRSAAHVASKKERVRILGPGVGLLLHASLGVVEIMYALK